MEGEADSMADSLEGDDSFECKEGYGTLPISHIGGFTKNSFKKN
jgi:hypothetical protein